MTIKQQGGVFGRSPVFNEAEAKDLTVTNSMNVDNGTLQVDPVNNRVGVKIAPTTDLHVYNAAGAMMRVEAAAAPAYLNLRNSTRSWNIYTDNVTGKLSFFDVTFGVERMALSTSGNLSFASGKGIDFSATSGTGTSELFDDYEEGTWTPVYTASTTDPTFASYPVRSAHYRKIGAMVFVTARFRTSGYNSDGVGNLRISGLPYAAKSSGSFFDTGGITIHSVQNWGSIPYNGVVKPGDAFISLIGSTGFVDQSVLALGTGTNNNDISFSGMYVTD
jgi:hypothetical protein